MKRMSRTLSKVLFGVALALLAACSAKTEDTAQISQAESPSPNDETAFFFFTGKGLQDFQAAGVVGNLDQESQMNPRAVQAGGPGRGIAQWSVGGRWDTLVSYANQRGEDPWALQTQLDFVWYELQTVPGFGLGALQASTTLADATRVFQNDYERCGTCAEGNRIKYAQEALAAYGGRGPQGAAGPEGIAASNAFIYNAEQHYFGRGTDGSLLHWYWRPQDGLGPVQTWGGGLVGDPKGYTYNQEQHVFARVAGDKLEHWYWNPNANGEQTWPDTLTSDPTGFVYGSGNTKEQHVFGRGADGTLTHWYWRPDLDAPQVQHWGGDKIVGSPVAYVWGGQQHVFARVEGDRLGHWWWDPSGTPQYTVWAGSVTSDPAGFAYFFGARHEQHAYARNAGGTLTHWYWDDGSQQVHSVVLSQPLVGAPWAYTWGSPDDLQQHIVAQSPNGTLAHWWWVPSEGDKGDQYADWGGSLAGRPTGFATSTEQQFFGRAADGSLHHWYYNGNVGNQTWAGPALAP